MSLFDFRFIGLFFGISAIGLIVLASASAVEGVERFGDGYYFVKHQLLNGVLPGIFLFLLMARLDYQILRKLAPIALAVTFVFLLLVLLPGIGVEFGGAKRWINVFGFFTFQPSEIIKLSFLLYLAAWLSMKHKEVRQGTDIFIPFAFLLAVIALFLMLEPDLGTLSVIVAIAVVMYFVSGGQIKHLAILFLGMILILALLIRIEPYRFDRFSVFLHPELDPQGIGYHANQALMAVGSGGLFGLGYGHSRQKYNFLPEVMNDSIFAVMAEELGFFLVTVIIVLLTVFLLRCLKIARDSPDDFGKLLAVGITTWIGFQTATHIGANIALVPLTGVPLPFFSYGGTALAVGFAAVGILVSISRRGALKRRRV